MSFLNDVESDSLRVERMIIHLIDRGRAFHRESEIPVQQEGFFLSRIIDHASSAVHSFNEHSQVRPILGEMGRGYRGFEDGGQELARLFWMGHVGQATAGAFFVFQLATDVPGDVLYGLIKYDYRAVVELSQDAGHNVLREIIQAFVKEKRAVQKFCLARFRDGEIEEAVCASDRMAEAPDLTDYFETYLGVFRSRSTEELSRRLNEAMRGALQDVRAHIPQGNVGQALTLAKVALQGRDIITNDDVVDAVMHGANRPDEEATRADIERAVRSKLKRCSLTDVEFRPDRRALQVQPRLKVKTAEDVKLEFPGEELGRSVTHERTKNGDVFTITTSQRLVEDDTLPIRAR